MLPESDKEIGLKIEKCDSYVDDDFLTSPAGDHILPNPVFKMSVSPSKNTFENEAGKQRHEISPGEEYKEMRRESLVSSTVTSIKAKAWSWLEQ